MNPIKQFMEEVEAKVLQKQSDVISLIKADHRKVDLLFDDYMKAENEADKQAILKSIVEDLKVHSLAEEKKVYPTLDKEDHDGTNESLEEHHLIKILLEELSGKSLASDKEKAKVKVLSEVVKHHVKEEEGKYLPELQESGADLDQLGLDFTSEKERLLADPASMEEELEAESAVKKPARGKAPTAKRTSAKKAPAKKASAKKPAKKAAAKKSPASKKAPAAKKASAKTASAKKAVSSKKAATKKAPAKAVTAKKAAAKKPAAKKASPAKKSAPVKLSTKKPAARRKAS